MRDIDLIKLMQRSMFQMKKNNSQFSLRSFARYLGISPASLSQFLSGKRDLSWKMADKISKKIHLSEEELKLLKKNYGQIPIKEIEIGEQQGFIIKDWHYYAILSLFETRDFKSDVVWISERLGLKKEIVKRCLNEMHKLELCRKDEDGLFFPLEHILLSTDEVPSSCVKSRHLSNMNDAAEALAYPLNVRDFTFSTMAINPDNIPQAKKIIRQFQKRIETVLEKGDKSEVYEICISLFPRTKISK